MNTAQLAILVGLIMLSYGCISQPQANSSPPIITNATPTGPGGNASGMNASNASSPPATNASNASNQSKVPELTQELCEAARGHWNECGSACRGAPPGTRCILMCVQYCECGGIAGFGCPDGYECAEYLPKDEDGNPVPDAMGVCRSKAIKNCSME